ncbi:MAG: sn-glycerol 3-phosphate transport system ATP-binding protein [Blastocatellia bacterium]|jgi:multiple sugar transport system ATP-binding protein|nr:sn-glycerol 3-phosphate transport system ATP-binding protein [Blastocatellia bacterium]
MTLSITDVRKHFGATRAVDCLTLEVHPAEFLVILGPSGCGKTTLIRLVAGLELPDSGKILMAGRDWTELPPQQRNVAMVFQQYALYPQRTVRGNIEYPLRLRKLSQEQRQGRVDRIASLLGINTLLERKPSQLSGGEAQRVALARALVREPQCFLLDEPLSNLDAQLRTRARVEIKRIQRELKVTTLYVTHDQEEAISLADRIALMDKGQLVQIGTAEDLFHRPETRFAASFLGKPPINLFDAIVTSENPELLKISLVPGNYDLPVSIRTKLARGAKLTVGFRPEHVRLGADAGGEEYPPSWVIPGVVEAVEGLAPDYVTHCATPLGLILVSVRAAQKPAEGPTELSLPAKMAHFFDAETGRRLD